MELLNGKLKIKTQQKLHTRQVFFDKAKGGGGHMPIFKCFVKMSKKSDEKQRKDAAMTINNAHFIPKEELPFTKIIS